MQLCIQYVLYSNSGGYASGVSSMVVVNIFLYCTIHGCCSNGCVTDGWGRGREIIQYFQDLVIPS